MKSLLESLGLAIPLGVKRRLLANRVVGPRLARVESYSIDGDDLVLARLIERDRGGQLRENRGFYVDVGAHHPILFSSTYLFYRQGWRGLNIDPMVGTASLFRVARPRDITVESAVANDHKEMHYYDYSVSAFNTCDEHRVAQLEAKGIAPQSVRKVQAVPLREILDRHLPQGQDITFMNIDVEGLELGVLVSNDWERFAPRYVMIEQLGREVRDSDITRMLRDLGYEMSAWTCRSTVFRRTRDE